MTKTRQFYYRPNGADVLGPASLDWLWERVREGEFNPGEVEICEVGSEKWIPFTAPDIANSAEALNTTAKAEQL